MKNIYIAMACLAGLLAGGTVFAGNDPVEDRSTVQVEKVQGGLKDLSPEELRWYRTFMKGTMLFDGWEKISQEILASAPPHVREQQRQQLAILGQKIGAEWCKDNAIRKVDNDMLKKWGKLLKKTAKKSPEQLPEVIASIDRQVSDLLN